MLSTANTFHRPAHAPQSLMSDLLTPAELDRCERAFRILSGSGTSYVVSSVNLRREPSHAD